MARLQANSPKLQTRLQAFTDWYSKAVIALTLGAVAALRLCGVPLLGTATEVRRFPYLLVPVVSTVQGSCVKHLASFPAGGHDQSSEGCSSNVHRLYLTHRCLPVNGYSDHPEGCNSPVQRD